MCTRQEGNNICSVSGSHGKGPTGPTARSLLAIKHAKPVPGAADKSQSAAAHRIHGASVMSVKWCIRNYSGGNIGR